MVLYENNKRIEREPRSVKEAKEMIAGLDYSFACVDVDPQSYKLVTARGKIIYTRPGWHVP